jgi:hypothetical protein
MTNNDLIFTHDPHGYTLAGKRIPGITSVLASMGYYPGSNYYTEFSRLRGHASHMAAYLVGENCPGAETLDDVLDVLEVGDGLHPYISGYLAALRETGFRPERREFPCASRRLNVACVPDQWGHEVIVELKSWPDPGPNCPRSAEIQTAAQALMAEEWLGLKTTDRMVFALTGNPSRTFRVYQCKGANDRNVATALCVAWWDKVGAKLLDWKGESADEEVAA